MKRFRFISLLMLLLAASGAVAQGRYIYANPVTIEPGGEADIVVKMDLDTDETVCDWFFLLHFPDGIDPGSTTKVFQSCILSEELLGPIDSSLAANVLTVSDYSEANNLRFLFYGFLRKNGLALKGTHGELFRFKVKSNRSETFTFTPDIDFVHITNNYGVSLVTDGVLQTDYDDYRNTLYIDDLSGCAGEDVTLSVKMRNAVPCEGFSFDLFTDGYVRFATDEEGMPLAALSELRTTTQGTNTFEAVLLNDIQLRVLASSTNGATFSGSDGEVCTVQLHIPENTKEGQYQLMLRDIYVSDANARSHHMRFSGAKLHVTSFHVGDANSDKSVNVADLTAIAHHILGNTPEDFNKISADANRDGKVNVADYTAVAHLILYGNISGPSKARTENGGGSPAKVEVGAGPVPARSGFPSVPAHTEADPMPGVLDALYIAPVQTFAGEEVTLSVQMRNSFDAEGFQFDLRLPEGVSVVTDADGFAEASLSTQRTTALRTNTFTSALHADGLLTVMAASTNASAISEGVGEVCTVRVRVASDAAPGNYDMRLQDIAISDTHARSHDLEQTVSTLTVADAQGIETALNAAATAPSTIYDLQGRRVEGVPRTGLYISGGRKFLSQ